jgi:hypothetical protein
MTDTDRQPTGEQQDTDATRQDATVGVVEAAQRLGITTDAVRSRLRRGTLEGHKVDGEWMVHLPEPTVGRQDADSLQQDATGDRQEGATVVDRTPTVDLSPLVSHIATLEEQVQRLTEASTMWQIRARQAEEQLKQLTAGAPQMEPAEDGGIAPNPETATIAPESPPANEVPPMGATSWWRRLLGL